MSIWRVEVVDPHLLVECEKRMCKGPYLSGVVAPNKVALYGLYGERARSQVEAPDRGDRYTRLERPKRRSSQDRPQAQVACPVGAPRAASPPQVARAPQ